MANQLLASIFDAVNAATSPDDWTVAATVKGLLIGYDVRWRETNQKMTLLESETTYTGPLVNLTTNKDSRTWRLAGKIDKLVNDNGRVLFDHKTTSSDIEDPNSPYWRQLAIEGQSSHYELLLLLNSQRIDRVIWDVIRKPGIKPKKLAAADRKSVTSLGMYCGWKVSPETQTALVTDERENEELYMFRVARESIDDPNRYFARRSVPRTREELADYNLELWEIGKEILGTRNSGRNFRNAGACMTYGSPCEYLGICSNHDSPDSEKWRRREDVHAELPEIQDGRNLLTNSRIRCYQTCRRKHHYRYDLGLERVDVEEREALYFGSLWGSTLDLYWAATCQKDENYVARNCESPASGVGN